MIHSKIQTRVPAHHGLTTHFYSHFRICICLPEKSVRLAGPKRPGNYPKTLTSVRERHQEVEPVAAAFHFRLVGAQVCGAGIC